MGLWGWRSLASLNLPVYEDDIAALKAVIDAASEAQSDNTSVDWEWKIGKSARFLAILQEAYENRKETNADHA